AREEGADFLCGFEEALGYTVGTVARDKDGVGSALVFADLAAWCRSRGVTVLDYLEEIQRRHGLYVAETHGFTFPGTEGAAIIQKVMKGFRDQPPASLGDHAISARLDYQKRERRVGNQVTQLTLPVSNVLAYELEAGGRVTLRPSGTEPKIKYYFELRETLAAGEALETARTRARTRLKALEAAFLTLARERGQPASSAS
ncbi:MAG TPA: phospho-sugar mutase, partial [Myxococcaceae bacterium]|nr:phospho-sugar mutase [Myxococcaceae bacterium]